MELSKFRRKPKTPAIATDAKSLTPEAESPPASQTPIAATNLKPQKPGLRKGAFRGLHLRSAVKRARSPAPLAPPALSSSPSNTVANDAHADSGLPMPMSPVSVRHRDGQAVEDDEDPDSRMPAFLNQSNDSIETKFQDMQWTERTRQNNPEARAADTNPNSNYPYTLYRLTDMSHGPMDRYSNIKPYERTRVRLQVPESTLDYVNASSITVPAVENKLPPLRYIAMQGPTQTSVDFVWRMVAEQFEHTAVIVQLTTMVENNLPKCFPYLPLFEDDTPLELNELDAWGDGWRAEVRLESAETLENGAIELRKLVLRIDPPTVEDATEEGEEGEEGEMDVSASTQTATPTTPTPEQDSREVVVWHMLYTRWPDFGPPAPEDVPSFLALMKLSREYCALDQDADSSQPAKANIKSTIPLPGDAQQKDLPPRIIHCSAGVGRTGTFIALEHLMRELDAGSLEDYDSKVDVSPASKRALAKDDSRDLVFQTVETLREQRPTMVQAPTQFVFLYQTLRKMWLDRYDPGDAEPAAKRLEIGDPFVD